MILLIDNYDSFSYNLYQLVGTLNPDITVIRNDEKSVEEIARMAPERIILSPGPGYPAAAGVCIEVVRRLGERFPILGVCLGHQAICEAYGARIAHAKRLMHGKSSVITADTSSALFRGLPQEMTVARYHAGLLEGHGACGRRGNHGGGASSVSRVRIAVPSGIDSDAGRHQDS